MQEKDGFTLSCIAYGDNFEAYNMRGNIKSITYNDMFIKEGEKVVLQVVVDI